MRLNLLLRGDWLCLRGGSACIAGAQVASGDGDLFVTGAQGEPTTCYLRDPQGDRRALSAIT